MNIKNFWKPKYSVCSECGVHFEPAIGDEARFGNLCSTHRKPVMERDRNYRAVMAWAGRNWEKLAPMMEEEEANTREQYNKALSEYMANVVNASQVRQFSQYGNEIGAWGIGRPPL